MMNAGRPTKATPEATKIILQALGAGVPFQVAANLAGVSDKKTIYTWIKKDPEFSVKVRIAIAQSETRLVSLISAAAGKQWQAAAWLLERHPKMRQRWKRDNYFQEPVEE